MQHSSQYHLYLFLIVYSLARCNKNTLKSTLTATIFFKINFDTTTQAPFACNIQCMTSTLLKFLRTTPTSTLSIVILVKNVRFNRILSFHLHQNYWFHTSAHQNWHKATSFGKNRMRQQLCSVKCTSGIAKVLVNRTRNRNKVLTCRSFSESNISSQSLDFIMDFDWEGTY